MLIKKNTKLENKISDIDEKVSSLEAKISRFIDQKIVLDEQRHDDLNARIKNIDDNIYSLQKSTRTLFKAFIPLHNWFRTNAKWYYNWSMNPKSSETHWITLVAVIVIALLLVGWDLGFFGGGKKQESQAADLNNIINFEGVLLDENGESIKDGEYEFTARIFSSRTGGECLWSWKGDCSNPDDVILEVKDGNYNLVLGDISTPNTNPITFNLNDGIFWLEITSDGNVVGPRKRVGAVDYVYSISGANSSENNNKNGDNPEEPTTTPSPIISASPKPEVTNSNSLVIGSSDSYQSILVLGAQNSNLFYYLPTSQGANNSFLVNSGDGILNWQTIDIYLGQNVTRQGNDFNNINQLVKLNENGYLPSLNASNLSNISGSSVVGNLNINVMPRGGDWQLSSNLDIGDHTLYVDYDNTRVGIGNNTPIHTLSVWGDVGIVENDTFPEYFTVFKGGDQQDNITYTLPTDDGENDYILSTDGNGILNWKRGNYMPNLGIATFPSDTFSLDVNGDVRLQSALYLSGITSSSAVGTTLNIDSNNNVYKYSSSQRYKNNISSLEIDTLNIYDLRPVSFTPNGQSTRTFGLIAEEVANTIPELVVFDSQGLPEAVRYQDLSVLLLNEMIKNKNKIDNISVLQNQVDDLNKLFINYKNNLIVSDQKVTINNLLVSDNLNVNGNLIVKKHLSLGIDSVGQAQIISGEKITHINFSQKYNIAPIVNITPVGIVNTRYAVDNISTEGFDIIIDDFIDTNATFNWQAIEPQNDVLFTN